MNHIKLNSSDMISAGYEGTSLEIRYRNGAMVEYFKVRKKYLKIL